MQHLVVTSSLVVALALGQLQPEVAHAANVKYAKTAVEEARGKCVAAIIGGGLLGAIVGSAVSKKGTGAGAGIGAVAGGGACAIIMANAKKADRIIAAQIASAQHQDSVYTTTFTGDGGSATTFEGRASGSEAIDAANLRPVRYMTLDGVSTASPTLTAGAQDCRAVSSSITDGDNGRADLPMQYVCRTPSGDYQPYGVQMADKGTRKKAA